MLGDQDAERIIKDFALRFPNYGYRMITAKLRLEGINFNHKKVYRIYKKLGLNFKANSKSRKLPARKRILEIANNSNQIWSLDFMRSRRLKKRTAFLALTGINPKDLSQSLMNMLENVLI